MVSEVNHVGYYRNISSLYRMSIWIILWCFVKTDWCFRFTFFHWPLPKWPPPFFHQMSPPVPREGKKEGKNLGRGKKRGEKSQEGKKSKRRRKIGTEAKKSKERGKSRKRGEKSQEGKNGVEKSLEGKNRRGNK